MVLLCLDAYVWLLVVAALDVFVGWDAHVCRCWFVWLVMCWLGFVCGIGCGVGFVNNVDLSFMLFNFYLWFRLFCLLWLSVFSGCGVGFGVSVYGWLWIAWLLVCV